MNELIMSKIEKTRIGSNSPSNKRCSSAPMTIVFNAHDLIEKRRIYLFFRNKNKMERASTANL